MKNYNPNGETRARADFALYFNGLGCMELYALRTLKNRLFFKDLAVSPVPLSPYIFLLTGFAARLIYTARGDRTMTVQDSQFLALGIMLLAGLLLCGL